jgi:hypothetical protein
MKHRSLVGWVRSWQGPCNARPRAPGRGHERTRYGVAWPPRNGTRGACPALRLGVLGLLGLLGLVASNGVPPVVQYGALPASWPVSFTGRLNHGQPCGSIPGFPARLSSRHGFWFIPSSRWRRHEHAFRHAPSHEASSSSPPLEVLPRGLLPSLPPVLPACPRHRQPPAHAESPAMRHPDWLVRVVRVALVRVASHGPSGL